MSAVNSSPKSFTASSAPAAGACNRLANLSQDGVLVADIRRGDAPLTYVNPAFERITGYAAREVVGKNGRFLQSGDRLQPELTLVRDAIRSRGEVHVTLRNYRKDGSLFWNELLLSPIFNRYAEPTHYLGIIRDVTESKELRLLLEQADQVDPLTSLANRSSFHRRVSELLTKADAAHLLVVKLDVARFHEINTSYGYEIGDLLLQEIADRLNGAWPGAAGRLAGDEFALALELAKPDDANLAMSDLHALLQARFAVPGAEIELRFAVGFVAGARGDDPMMLIRQAGVALQESRRSLLRKPRGFDGRREADIKARVSLTRELHGAAARGDLVLHYQPKVELKSRRIIGTEALIRWNHPVFGLQSPDQFIPLAEETGLILEIGAWVLREAAHFAVRLNRNRNEPIIVSLNVSQIQFTAQDMPALIRAVLDETGAEPSWMTIELTETLCTDRTPEMIDAFGQLRNMGLGLSIDDFGTGYSSLSYLDRFPVTEVKIDRSFIRDLHQSRVSRVIVEALIRLGAELNIMITAEGVENESQRAMLQGLGCIYGQGYLFKEPVSAHEFLSLVQGERRLVGTSVRRTSSPARPAKPTKVGGERRSPRDRGPK